MMIEDLVQNWIDNHFDKLDHVTELKTQYEEHMWNAGI